MGEKVELHQSFQWDCPACGRENFVRAVTLAPESLDDEDRADIEEQGFDPDEGAFVTAPAEVTCGGCRRTFTTEEH